MLRYRVTRPDGKRVEHGIPVGLVRDFPKAKDAWREVDKLGLLVRINDARMIVASGLTPSQSITSKPISGPTQSARSPKTPNSSRSISSETISPNVGAERSLTTSSRLTCSVGSSRCTTIRS